MSSHEHPHEHIVRHLCVLVLTLFNADLCHASDSTGCRASSIPFSPQQHRTSDHKDFQMHQAMTLDQERTDVRERACLGKGEFAVVMVCVSMASTGFCVWILDSWSPVGGTI